MPKSAKSLAGATDAELLDAIGSAQDRAAFAELYERHKDRAYGLIFHIVRDRQRAEDALQDAFLNVWRHAGGLRDLANARGWILRVAANEALRSVKAGRHARRNLELDAERHEAAPEDAREGAPVDPELSAALNAQLEKLEPEQRNLIALYYAGNLSQREIGEALDITQQAISRKMTAALEALRRGLSQAGYAAALPLLEGGRLAEALGAQNPAPAALGAKMLRVLNAPAEASRRAAPVAGGSGPLIAAALVCAAAAGGAYLYISSGTQSTKAEKPEAPKAPETPKTQSVTPAGTPAARFHAKWDFNDAKQLDALFGTGHGMAFVPNEDLDGRGCLDTGADLVLRYLPGLPKLNRPIRLRWREKFVLNQTSSPPTRVFVSWTDESYRTFAPIRNAGEILTSNTDAIPWRRSEVYITENFCAGWLDEKLSTVEYHELAADPKLMFAARGRYLFDEFEVEEVEPNDVPDLSVYAKFIAAIPPERRVGQVNAPDLASPQPGKEVFVEFLKSPVMDAAKKSER
ncbi:MAG: sigma-70 family RNA polymerase sigma factor [Planctomycetes bacterium]|nr:sigma-70 family RNA polymerase sigma factor [Planctomycetota bacterium]